MDSSTEVATYSSIFFLDDLYAKFPKLFNVDDFVSFSLCTIHTICSSCKEIAKLLEKVGCFVTGHAIVRNPTALPPTAESGVSNLEPPHEYLPG